MSVFIYVLLLLHVLLNLCVLHEENNLKQNTGFLQNRNTVKTNEKQIKMENRHGNKQKKSLWWLSYSLNNQKRQQRAERQRKHERREVKEETEGESRLVKAQTH